MATRKGPGGYSWDTRYRRYRGPSGRFVSNVEIRRALDVTLQNTTNRIRDVARDLQAGRITLRAWELETRRLVKDVQLYSVALAKGGWANMTPADYGRVGQLTRAQYDRLWGFAQEIQSGSVPMDGRFLVRAGLYAQSGRAAYEAQRVIEDRAAGLTEERNILAGRDHCTTSTRPGCVDETRRGWQPLGTLSVPGTRTCLGNCRCRIIRR